MAYLNARFTEAQGQVGGTRLFLEIQARGYRGSRQVVRKHLAALRAGTAEPVRADIPSPRKITSWIMRPRETLTESQDERLLQVRLACPDITRACDLARAYADLVRHQRGYLLLEWIRQAEQDAPKPMKGFAGFLRQDLDAVTAGLTLPCSSGVVEGHVNRVKTLKRAMYGRASFELPRSGSSPSRELHGTAGRADSRALTAVRERPDGDQRSGTRTGRRRPSGRPAVGTSCARMCRSVLGASCSTKHSRARRDGDGPQGYLRRQGRGRRGAVRGSAGLRVDPGAGPGFQP